MPFSHTIGIDARKAQDFGIGTYIRNLVGALAEIDVENRYVLLANREGREALPELPDNFRIVTESAKVYSMREIAAMSFHLRRLELDLYHSTHYVLPAMLPCPAVATIHDIIHLLYPDFLPNRLALLYAQRMIRSTLARGSRIIAVSQNTKDDLVEYFDTQPEKIEVIHNGVEDTFRQQMKREDVDRWLKNLEVERPYLLFVGNPKPHKNLDNVVKAYARALRIKRFDGQLVCVGARRAAEFKIHQRAEQLGIGDRIQLLGHVAQEALPALYQGAELFVYPTLYEGFGLPVVEAMASGTAVLTSNTSALREIAEGYAHLVDPLNVEAMAAAIAQCMTDQEHREALALSGRERAEEFRWERAARCTLGTYLTALGDPAASRYLPVGDEEAPVHAS